MGFFKWFRKNKQSDEIKNEEEQNLNIEDDITKDEEEQNVSLDEEKDKQTLAQVIAEGEVAEATQDGIVNEKLCEAEKEEISKDNRDKDEEKDKQTLAQVVAEGEVVEAIQDGIEDKNPLTIDDDVEEKKEQQHIIGNEFIDEFEEDEDEQTLVQRVEEGEIFEPSEEENNLEYVLIKEDIERDVAEIEEIEKEMEEIAEALEEVDVKAEVKKKAQELEDLSETEQEDVEEVEQKKVSFFSKIKKGLAKTRDSILNGVEQVLGSFSKIDEELFEELEEALIMADMGVDTSTYIISKVRDIVKQERIKEVSEVKNVIVRVISDILEEDTQELELKKPSVLLIIGVNGVGKTTTIGKLTHNYKIQGRNVLLAAGDTFRAAAIDQLKIWGDRNNVDVIKHQEGSDPAAVVFDAIKAGKARGTDLLICDTAGRLHNKKNLMEELKKIARIVHKENPEAQVETFLVLDATTGQNALQQAKLFSEVADITGIVLTKLDGTAKGGVVISIKNELNIPVRFIGVGEGIEDLRPFNAKEFSKALFE